MREAPCDGLQHQGDGIAAGGDRKPRKSYAGDGGSRRGGVRHSRRCHRVEVNDPGNKRHRLVLQLQNSEAAHFEKTGEGGRRPRNKAILNRLDMNTVVRHQTREDESSARRRLNEVEHQPGFAGAGGAPNEDCSCAGQHRRSVNGGSSVHERLHRQQPDEKARAKDPILGCRIARLPRGNAVLRHQLAVMRFHDLLRDRQAKP
jgi:hypothetical protein